MYHQVGATYIQTWAALGSPSWTAIWSPNWERVPGGVPTPPETANCSLGGSPPLKYLSCKLIASSVCVQKYCTLVLLTTFYNAVLFRLVSHRVSLDPREVARPSGLKEIQDPLPFPSASPGAVLVGRHGIQAVSRQIEAGQSPALLLLKPEQDFLHLISVDGAE